MIDATAIAEQQLYEQINLTWKNLTNLWILGCNEAV